MKILFKKHPTKVATVILLIAASVVAVATFGLRVIYSGSWRYGFLLWNLFLAWIPLLCASSAYFFSLRPIKGIYSLVAICGLAWFLFFPNAPYILTDFQHIAFTEDVTPVWYDVILLAWFAWTGQLLGVTALYVMQEIVSHKFNAPTGWAFTTSVIALSSFGVYLGRFLRWNSWDVLNNPVPLAQDILDRAIHPLSHPSTLAFTVLFTLLFLFIYSFVYLFGHVHNETRAIRNEEQPATA